ncbi:MAG: hypothetical protein ACYDFT_02460 [Thermoplasmata archaeon]
MTETCSGCGAEVEFEIRGAEVRRATCAGCSQVTEVLKILPFGQSAPEVAAPATPSATPAAFTISCPECEGRMTLRIAGPDLLEAKCGSCEAMAAFARQGDEEEDEEDDAPAAPKRPWSRPPSGGGGGFRSDAPRARPCRECGGDLRFATQPDGMVRGECSSCGNSFVLPPRARDGEGRGRPPGRGFDRDSRPRYGGGGGFDPRRGGRGRPSGPPSGGRFRDRSERSEGSQGPPVRRRRKPREDE